jgi:hypothetical protein
VQRCFAAPPLELLRDGAIAWRDRSGFLQRGNCKIKVCGLVGDFRQQHQRRDESWIRFDGMLEIRNGRIRPAERECRITGAVVEGRVARTAFELLAENRSRFLGVPSFQRRPGFRRRQVLIRRRRLQ